MQTEDLGNELVEVNDLNRKHNLLQSDINTNREILAPIVAESRDLQESLSEEGRQYDTFTSKAQFISLYVYLSTIGVSS